MKKGSLVLVALGISFLLANPVGAAAQVDKAAPSRAKEPVRVEAKGGLIYEHYNGASSVHLPSEKEIAKKHGKKVNKGHVTVMSAYDDTDPEISGCANDAITAKSVVVKNKAGTVLATTELRYSPTCRTAWGRMYVNDYNSTRYGEVILYRAEYASDGNRYYTYKTETFVSPGDTNYTNQFNDAGTTSYAHGFVSDRYGNDFGAKTAPY
ncbi:DUF2690 domain-containing protein [Laceyella putida]|uniref:DUF2690 domain-containing protein n=1 Tax=Laceyella putida TaxID=110101 RepID=A0ABW2RHC1_9BACL